MRRFTELYSALDATTSTLAKTDALIEYLRGAPPQDAAWAVAIFLGQRPRGTASSRVVTQLALESSGVPRWMFDECRAAVGELAETISLLLPEAAIAERSTEGLAEVIRDRVRPLAGASDEERAAIIRAAWASFDSRERLVYLKLIRGGFRVGVQRRMLCRALAVIADVEPAVVEHRLAGTFTPSAEAYLAIISGETDEEHRARPYPFYLASQLEASPASLGDRAEWIAEWKWDGIRAQIVRRDEVSIWSRGGELITHQFPEITSAAGELPTGTVLDGEIVIWRGDRPATFAALQTRLNRKAPPAPQLPLFATESPVFIAFDLLEQGGHDLRGIGTGERRAGLSRVLAGAPGEALRVSPAVEADTWSALEDARAQSRDRGVEGLMLKHVSSPYAAGRVKPEDSPGWWKWKVDPHTADAVLVYAYPGSGRRATLYTDYAFAVWGERDGERALLPFTRAYSGLDQQEIESLDAWIRRNTVRTMGPAREVRPERVFEIAFEGIAASGRHRAGVAVRFPRILRERTDKAPEDADSVESLRMLLRLTDPDAPR